MEGGGPHVAEGGCRGNTRLRDASVVVIRLFFFFYFNRRFRLRVQHTVRLKDMRD